MSDERSVEARLLTLLTLGFASGLTDTRAESLCWRDTSGPAVPQHIVEHIQDTADFSSNPSLRRLARLGLAVLKKTNGDPKFDSLALESCTRVYDAISGSLPAPDMHALTRLLEEIETLAYDTHPSSDQVQEYRRRLSCILDEVEDVNGSSTSFRVQDTDTSARLRYVLSPPVAVARSEFVSGTINIVTTESDADVDIHASRVYCLSMSVYHATLLHLPATYAALASDVLSLQENDTCEVDVWDTFTKILLKQWKTLGLLSTLIFGATLTMFQLPSITSSSILRTLAHSALLCVMMSLIYMSVLSVYFGGCKSSCSVGSWAQEICTADPHTFWNFWVLISLPAVWTCWGIFLFVASIVLFVWPLGQSDAPQDSPQDPLAARISLMLLVLAGAAYLALSISMLRRKSRRNSVSQAVDV
ncbi:hypothetical protein B0H10DRAFT_863135 [Mycena sp. CBHHK59/15]|nr:hypothetical protein B0H10DRAFT_863135 [Mycena sp. CBHHK59/15]